MEHAPAKQALLLAAFVGVCLTAGAIGSLATAPQIPTWYAGLAKPDWNPPSWVFAPVWTSLYILMGFAGWNVWRKVGELRWTSPFGVYWAQLGLNALWSFLFFGMEAPGLAFAEILLLWVMILLTMRVFALYSKAAVWLMLPYLAWVSFAAVLNFTIWRLNSGLGE